MSSPVHHKHGVGGGLARGAGADHVAAIGDEVALGLERGEQLDRAELAGLVRRVAGARVLQHGERMQRDVGAAPGVGRGRQVVGVGFARYLEDRDREAFRHAGARGEPFGVRPGLQHGFRVGVAGIGERFHLVEIIEHEKRMLQRLRRRRAAFRTGEKRDQRLDVEAAEHRAEKLRRPHLGNERGRFLARRHLRQILGLHARRVVNARRNAVRDEIEQERLLARGRVPEQADQLARLLLGKRQRRDSEGGAFGGMGAVGFKHRHNSLEAEGRAMPIPSTESSYS